jgi:protein-disulfide isomerase
MSKKTRTQSPPPAAPDPGIKTRTILMAAGGGLLLFVLAMWFFLGPKVAPARTEAELSALQRPHAATMGSPEAKVTIVEFMDPACETCREFYPLVKAMLKDNPGKLRLSIRLLAFHPNAEVPVKALEAAKRQDKFWPVLERFLATQTRWVKNHRVDADAVMAELQSSDVDFAKLQADMKSPEVAKVVAQDAQDAKTLKVTATPEYFVNGRGLPDFGYDRLRELVTKELASAYR